MAGGSLLNDGRDVPAVGILDLGRASIVYALGGLAYKGVALLAIPILARLLSPVELGLLDLAAVLASIVSLLVAIGSVEGVAYLESRSSDGGRVWGSALAIIVVVAVALCLAALFFQEPLARLITDDPGNRTIFLAVVVYGGIIAISAMALNAVRLHGSPAAYALTSFAIVATEMIGALAVAWLVQTPVTLMILAWAVGAALISIPVLFRYAPTMHRPSLRTMRQLATYGAPLVPAVVIWLLGDAWIRSTLARETQLASLGAYGIAYRLASIVGLAVAGFSAAWHPYIYRSPPSDITSRASGAMAYVVLALAALGVIVTALAPELIGVLAGPEYREARVAVAGLVGGMIALGGFVLISAVVGASGSTRRVALAAIAGVATQIIASGPLIGAYGLAGAATASLIGYVVAVVLLGLSERPLFTLHNAVIMVLVALLAATGLTVATSLLDQPLAPRALLVIAYSALAVACALGLRAMRRRWPRVGH